MLLAKIFHPSILIDNDNRRISGERNYDGGREPHRHDRKDGDRKGMPRGGRQEPKRQGSEEIRRDKTPPPMKKFEEAKVPVSLNFTFYRFVLND